MQAHEKELILGQSGSGKTFEMIQRFKKVVRGIYLDITADTNISTKPQTMIQSSIIYNDVYDLLENLVYITSLSKFKLIAKLENVDDYEIFFEYLWLSRIRNFVLFVDEIHLFAPSKSISDYLKNIVVMGRHRNINLVLASQRPLMVNPVIRSQMTKITTFRQTEKRDLQILSELGFNPSQVSRLNFSKHEKITLDFSDIK